MRTSNRGESGILAKKKPPAQLARKPAPPRILLVDDHDLVRRGIKQLLQAGLVEAQFGEARDASEALSLIREGWELVLLDISLPGKSGLDILPLLKKAAPDLPILVLSAFGEEQFAIRTLKAGAAGYINKCAVDEEVVTAVRKVLAGGQYVSPTVAENLLLDFAGRAKNRPRHELLSDREFQVMRLIASGKTLKEIAGDLEVSEKTISTYRSRITEKTGLGTQVEIARYALQHGLVE